MFESSRVLRGVCAAFTAVALAATTLVAAPHAVAAGPETAPNSAGRPTSVVYVEVNSNDLRNAADYVLAGTDRPAFDIAVIFAANINGDGPGARLHLNERVQATLQDERHQIRPLQARGTKVLLSVLGNHQGTGIANFTSYAEADAFAAQLEAVVKAHRLDGIDFDDEWAEYGINQTPQPNGYSFLYLLKALRARLGPEKLITFYNIGPAMDSLVHDGENGAQYIDYAFNPYYGTWSPPQIPGLTKQQLAPGAIDLTQTPAARAASLAQRTTEEGYGALITYNLTAGDHAAYLSGITIPLKGHATVKLGRDTTAPTATIRRGHQLTIPKGRDAYRVVSYLLQDAGGIAEVVINGVVTELPAGQRSAIDRIRPGAYGAVRGHNTMVVHDVAGNTATFSFVLV